MFKVNYCALSLIVSGFNDQSTVVCHFVSSPREGEEREKNR